MKESLLRERVMKEDHNPTLKDLFEQGYILECFCGKKIASLEEFEKHDAAMKDYYSGPSFN
jgi:hypothetical protein